MSVPYCSSSKEVCIQDGTSDVGIGYCGESYEFNFQLVVDVPEWHFGFGDYNLNGQYEKRAAVELADGTTVINGYPINTVSLFFRSGELDFESMDTTYTLTLQIRDSALAGPALDFVDGVVTINVKTMYEIPT